MRLEIWVIHKMSPNFGADNFLANTAGVSYAGDQSNAGFQGFAFGISDNMSLRIIGKFGMTGNRYHFSGFPVFVYVMP